LTRRPSSALLLRSPSCEKIADFCRASDLRVLQGRSAAGHAAASLACPLDDRTGPECADVLSFGGHKNGDDGPPGLIVMQARPGRRRAVTCASKCSKLPQTPPSYDAPVHRLLHDDLWRGNAPTPTPCPAPRRGAATVPGSRCPPRPGQRCLRRISPAHSPPRKTGLQSGREQHTCPLVTAFDTREDERVSPPHSHARLLYLTLLVLLGKYARCFT